MKSKAIPEQFQILPELARWIFFASLVGLLAGCASAGFLISLEWVTTFRDEHRWLIYLLPIGGFLVGWLYYRFGRGTEAGNNLLLEEIHNPKATVPLRMVPLVLFGTLATHFFGGSAGREGTAVQMAGALADQVNKIFKLSGETRRLLLMAGMAAGFASVFGTPLAGAIFGLEVLSVGRIRYEGIFPCFVAAFVGHFTTLAWGVSHTHYSIGIAPDVTATGLLWAFAAGIAFGVIGMFFGEATHWISARLKKAITYAPLRPFVGGVVVAALVLIFGLWRYVGLGVPVIVESLQGPVPVQDFAWKFLLTVLTLGAGFKGGEVTPLFFIGATFGNALSHLIPLPSALLGGMGFVAVFGGAANVPLASIFMAIELFGGQGGVYVAIACVASYLFSGHSGIYRSQRLGSSKYASFGSREGTRLQDL